VTEKLITVRDVSRILGISEKEVIELSEDGVIPAYKIAGTHLRFRREQIQRIKQMDTIQFKTKTKQIKYSLTERIIDFIYFNDFYILALVLIAAMIYIIYRQ